MSHCHRWGNRKILKTKGGVNIKVIYRYNCISVFPLVGLRIFFVSKRFGQDFLVFLNIFSPVPSRS